MAIIDTRLGKIEGVERDGVHHFLGIRYGEPPIGPRRFAAPVPAAPWTGVYDATAWAPVPMQPPDVFQMGDVFGTLNQSEDCLFLNVQTPACDGARRPVVFWIPGGGYIGANANSHDSTRVVAANDVVAVSANYRVGAFGFLDLSEYDPALAGSASNGFRDQILALQWVRDNIADFGGDPDNVSIAGISAGGGSALALIAAPAADGLFRRALALSPGFSHVPPHKLAPKFGKYLKVDDGALLERMRSLTADELLDAQITSGYQAAGTIDGTVVTRSPVDAITERGAACPPILTGTVRDEGFNMVLPGNRIMQRLFVTAFATGVRTTASGYTKRLRKAYAGRNAYLPGVVWAHIFRSNAVAAAEAAAAAGVDAWLYRFDVATVEREGTYGADHGSDFGFVFDLVSTPPFGEALAGVDRHTAERLAAVWSKALVQFARTGSPDVDSLPPWPKYDTTRRASLVFDVEPHIVEDVDAEGRRLWDGR